MSVTDEYIGGLPIGPGTRVPMLICSPWTRGGYVDSNVYDHTSMPSQVTAALTNTGTVGASFAVYPDNYLTFGAPGPSGNSAVN